MESALTPKYKEVIDKMVDDLPPELDDEQKGKVRTLLT